MTTEQTVTVAILFGFAFLVTLTLISVSLFTSLRKAIKDSRRAQEQFIVSKTKEMLLQTKTQVDPGSVRQIENALVGEMKKVPDFVLQSLTGTANAEKGKLGELIGYLTMKAEYDKIIPLGGIVDFVGIKFPNKDETEKGHVHFIDIKTGKGARLTPDQRRLKKLLDADAVNFRTIKVDDIETK